MASYAIWHSWAGKVSTFMHGVVTGARGGGGGSEGGRGVGWGLKV